MWKICSVCWLIAIGTSILVPYNINHQTMAAVPMQYDSIITRAESGHFNRITVWYLDPQIMTRVMVTPKTLPQIGCRIEIQNKSAEWGDLITILKAEIPHEMEGASGEVRWGIIFHEAGGAIQEIFFGAYYGPLSEDKPIFGYVNTNTVQFSANLPKKMSAFIQPMKCVN